MDNDSISFEEAFKRLEIIVKRLERGDVSLDESLKLFSDGALLIAECKNKIDAAEQIVKKLVITELGSVEEIDFSEGDES